MENALSFLILGVLFLGAIRLAAVPLKLLAKISIHGILGMLCLWLLNSAAWLTGLTFPINAVTALLTGYLGLPGIALTALLRTL